MRNRGIEIYLLNETALGIIDEYDQMSLIYSQGLKNTKHIQTLLEIHRYVAEKIMSEKPQLNDLLQTASLMAQIDRHMKNANIFEAAVEIYCKTRSPQEFSQKDIRTQILNWIYIEEEKNFSDTITLDTKSIETFSTFRKIQQQATFLDKYYDNIELLTYLVANFFAVTSPEDLEMRNFYFQKDPFFCPKLFAESCYQIALRESKCARGNMPLDNQWFPDSDLSMEKIYSVRLNLSLYIEAFYYLERSAALSKRDKQESDKKELLSCLQLKQKKKILDSIDDVVAKSFLRLIKLYDEFISNIINPSMKLGSSEVISFLTLLMWRFYLYKSIVVSSKMNSNEIYNVIMRLRLHYKWFHKHSIEAISTLTKQPIPVHLNVLVQTLNCDLHKQFSLLKKVGKKFMKSSDPPKPFTDPLQLEMVTIFNNVLHIFTVCDITCDPIRALNIYYHDKEVRRILVEISSKFSDASEYTLEKINLLESLLQKYKGACPTGWTKFELQVLPVTDYIIQLTLRENQNCVHIKDNMLLPVDLSAVIYRTFNEIDRSLSHEFTKSYHFYLMYSSSTMPDRYFGLEESKFVLSSFNPKMSYFMYRLLIASEDVDNLSIINLGNYREVQKQHTQLGRLLWKNLYQLSDDKYDYM